MLIAQKTVLRDRVFAELTSFQSRYIDRLITGYILVLLRRTEMKYCCHFKRTTVQNASKEFATNVLINTAVIVALP